MSETQVVPSKPESISFLSREVGTSSPAEEGHMVAYGR